MNWIKDHVTLSGQDVRLVPMEEKHFEELNRVADHEKIWEFIPTDMSTAEKRRLVFSMALNEREKGTQFPFVIISNRKNKIIGSTRLMNMEEIHLKLEIGWTWLHPDYWASRVNMECKLLLLGFCFETLKAVRVQLRTDETNIRSRKAIAKIGGKFEGILRMDWIRDNGTVRNTAYYSLLNDEWENNKSRLEALLAKK
jgi:RimJ/RimL family protein N-acetyltransferase